MINYAIVISTAVILMSAGSLIASPIVVPCEPASMRITINAGEYTIGGKQIVISETVSIRIDPQEQISIKNEEHIIESKPEVYFGYIGGTMLSGILSPTDGTRLADAIAPKSVKAHSQPDGGTFYLKGTDYELDDKWGGLWRTETGSIPKDAKTYIDYDVNLQRIDQVVYNNGEISLIKGKPSLICPEIPIAGKEYIPIANIFIGHRTSLISSIEIFNLPEKKTSWKKHIKTSGRQYLNNTLALLKSGKKVNIVCWGDSVTAGGSSSTHDKCYVELFRKQIKEEYPKCEINLVNAGIGGSNTESRRAGFDDEVLALNPDLITVEFVNDIGLGPEKIKQNWAEFMKKARDHNPKVEFILITPHFMRSDWMNGFHESAQGMRDAAKTNKAALADTSYTWSKLQDVGIPYETLLANEINHPNDLGHEFFTAGIMKLLKEK